MFSSPDDPRHGAFEARRQELFALSFWDKRIFSATVDQFLGFLQNQYASLCLLPVLAESVVVIDEVHSFDRSMFTALERFLRSFRIPALCMTATLPRDRVRILVAECGLQSFPKAEDSFPDLDRESESPRYKVRLGTQADAFRLVEAAVAAGKRVLWVCNQVGGCQNKVDSLGRTISPERVLCYHSRFRLLDRKRRHEEAIRRFRVERPLVLASTQVCEMSLNLDADLLVSELAPVPALIQRMGRCCRRKITGGGEPGEVLFYPPQNPHPYEQAELDQGLAFARDLSRGSGAVAQAELARRLDHLEAINPVASDGFAAFLDCGLLASSHEASFREGEDFAVDALLDSDVEQWLELVRCRNPLARSFIVPAPRRLATPDPRLPWNVRVVPTGFYQATTGLHNHEVQHA
jgi:CRISPR-associated endonuclease/helicase Cas3